MTTLDGRLQVRHDTAANWTSANPVLAAGEPGFEDDTGRFKFGNGSAAWSALPYFLAPIPVATVELPANSNDTVLLTIDPEQVGSVWALFQVSDQTGAIGVVDWRWLSNGINAGGSSSAWAGGVNGFDIATPGAPIPPGVVTIRGINNNADYPLFVQPVLLMQSPAFAATVEPCYRWTDFCNTYNCGSAPEECFDACIEKYTDQARDCCCAIDCSQLPAEFQADCQNCKDFNGC